jgi:centromeric protein E
LKIYNEVVYDLPAPSRKSAVQIRGGNGGELILTPLREEVVTKLKGWQEVLNRGKSNRRTVCTGWNEKRNHSHSVFRMVVESWERMVSPQEEEDNVFGRSMMPPTPIGRKTPGDARLQARDGKGVTTAVLSLIDSSWFRDGNLGQGANEAGQAH